MNRSNCDLKHVFPKSHTVPGQKNTSLILLSTPAITSTVIVSISEYLTASQRIYCYVEIPTKWTQKDYGNFLSDCLLDQLLCMVRTGITWGTARDPISVPSSHAIIPGSPDHVTSGSVIPPPTANVTQWQQNICRDAKWCTARQGSLPYISW